MTNVTKISSAHKKKQSEKLSGAEICRALGDAVSRSNACILPDFPARYEVLEPKPGVSIPLLVAPDESVTVVTPKALENDLVRYCLNELGDNEHFVIKPRAAKEAADHYLASAVPVPAEKIKATRWLSEPGLTYRRLPWDLQEGLAPTWAGLLKRMSNHEAFCDWVGSLFFEDAHMHNYIWLYGVGGDGKGAISRFLAGVFGAAYEAKDAPSRHGGTPDKFWTYNLLGKRVVVFGDCEDARFTTNGFFKSLTGGDAVPLEPKGGQAFSATLAARYMILANVKPWVSTAASDMRRIIYCEMQPLPADHVEDMAFEKRLWDEGGFFLSACVASYQEKYPTHGALRSNREEVQHLAEENEQYLENFFNKYFKLNPKAVTTPAELGKATEEAWPRQRATKSTFLRWLERVHGIKSKAEREGDQVAKGYKGMEARFVILSNDGTAPDS